MKTDAGTHHTNRAEGNNEHGCIVIYRENMMELSARIYTQDKSFFLIILWFSLECVALYRFCMPALRVYPPAIIFDIKQKHQPTFAGPIFFNVKERASGEMFIMAHYFSVENKRSWKKFAWLKYAQTYNMSSFASFAIDGFLLAVGE